MVNGLPEQLIAQAESLIQNAASSEADLRRAVSSAYYGLFHLLIRDAVANWKHPDQHGRLARTFDHKRMKEASKALLREIGSPPQEDAASKLSKVALAFVELQNARLTADYDIAESYSAKDAVVALGQARLAFLTWTEIRDHPLSQSYLYTLLFKDRS